MDCETGHIYKHEVIKQLIESGAICDDGRFKEMQVLPTERQMSRKPPRIGRNDPCPCGSGRKFKVCCLRDKSDTRFDR